MDIEINIMESFNSFSKNVCLILPKFTQLANFYTRAGRDYHDNFQVCVITVNILSPEPFFVKDLPVTNYPSPPGENCHTGSLVCLEKGVLHDN